jgi:hypothetical protein
MSELRSEHIAVCNIDTLILSLSRCLTDTDLKGTFFLKKVNNPDLKFIAALKNQFMKKRIVPLRIKSLFHSLEEHASRLIFTLDVHNNSVKFGEKLNVDIRISKV